MTKQKQIFMYSSFPLTQVDNYFKEHLIKPLTYRQHLDKTTYLPSASGFPKLYLLKIEHELSLNDSVHIHSSFLNDTDYECISDIAAKYDAKVEYIFLQTTMDTLYDSYKKKKGALSYDEFCNRYAEYYHFPLDRVEQMTFVQI